LELGDWEILKLEEKNKFQNFPFPKFQNKKALQQQGLYFINTNFITTKLTLS